MHVDVTSLWDFYYHAHLGAVAQRTLQRALRGIWGDVRGCNLVGYGFAAPVLRPFRAEAARTLCLMPEVQGARTWPRDGNSLTTLVQSGAWPLPNGFVDRLIVLHGVENERHLDDLMDEVWRVLAAEGKVLIIAANRSGLWARRDTTPFGNGRPWTYRQLESMLRQHDLTPVARNGALYMPPSERRFWLRSAGAAERFGRRLDAQRWAGALIVEAVKQVFAMPRSGLKEPAGGLLDPIKGLAPTPPKPVGAASRD